MSLRRTQPVRFSPAGLSDSLDETDEFPGACAILQNLVPDPTTRNIWTCRPASTRATAFASFTSPTGVVNFQVLGSLVYGLISTGRTPGYDEPFCYNLATNAFITVSGITSGNVPRTQATTGDWSPPTMSLCGVNLVVTHPGFDGITNFFGWFDTSNPAAPVWHAGNVAAGSAFSLTTVPSWVQQFNGRAWFGLNPPTGQPSVVFTDSLTLKITNAGQALTFGDNLPLTACGPLELDNQLGGIVQALMVFKGTTNIIQITGDYASSSIALNTLNVATGTLSPWSLVATPIGIAFVAPDGLRIVDQTAHVSDPIGADGKGVSVPFRNALYPSRISAASNAAVIRISLQNGAVSGNPWQEYWFDLVRKVWSGPHTFPAVQLQPYGTQFIVAPQAAPASLFASPVSPTLSSGSVENGVALQFNFQTAVMADAGEMKASELTDFQIKTTAVSGTPTMQVTVQDENGTPYGTTSYSFNATASVWGTAKWGVDPWGGGNTGLHPRAVYFSAPVVYDRLAVSITGACAQGFKIGDLFLRRRELGYLQR